jgi:cytochrome c-type biogenesis protein
VNASIGFAFAAGLLATVNPCGFAMLPSFLSLYLGERDTDSSPGLLGRIGHVFLVGVVLSAAFGGVFMLAGLIVSAGLRSFLPVVPWLATAIGATLLVVGLAMLAGRHIGLTAADRVGVRQQAGGLERVAIFGLTYAVASLSCTLAVFLVVVGQATAAGDPLELLAVFGAYAAGSASVLVALAMTAALAKGTLERGLRRLLPVVSRVSGALLAVSGAYLILYWLPALGGGGPSSDSWAAGLSDVASSLLAEFFRTNASAFAIVLGVLTVLGVGCS